MHVIKYHLVSTREYHFPPCKGEADWIVRVELYQCNQNGKNVYLPRLRRRDRFVFDPPQKKGECQLIWVEDLCIWPMDATIIAHDADEAFAVMESFFASKIDSSDIPQTIMNQIITR